MTTTLTRTFRPRRWASIVILCPLLVSLLLGACGGGRQAEPEVPAVPLEEPKDFESQLNPPVPVRLQGNISEQDLYVRSWPILDKFMSIKAGAETHGLTLTDNGNWVKVTVPGLGQKGYICRCFLELTDPEVPAQGLDAPCAEPRGVTCQADMEEQFAKSQRLGEGN